MKITQIKKLYKNFGVGIALPAVCASSFKAASNWKHRKVIAYLKSKYSEVISRYKQANNFHNNNNNSGESNTIWTLWWQGNNKEDLPEVVKLCFESMEKNRGTHSLKILTQYNYQEYIHFPEHVMKNFAAGEITITHLSDLMRVYLLSRFGGLWLDATIFVANKIPDEIFSMKYYTIKRNANSRSRNISQQRWTGFVQGAEKACIICNFIYDFLNEYWSRENCLIDYFLIDYIIEIALEEIPECRKIFDAIPINNPKIYELHKMLTSKWNEEYYETLKLDNNFFKLAWRTDYKEEALSEIKKAPLNL